MKTIVVDMMGSDLGTKATVPGLLTFLKKHPDIQVIAVGKKEELKELEGKCEIIDTPDVVPMDVSAKDVMRMRSSSLMVAIQTMKDRDLDAVVSAGSTGGFLTAATIKLKLIEGVQRAALVSPFPTKIKGKKVTILDIGANNENNAEQLVQFAILGSIYANKIFDIEEPKIYLLSNGVEEEKGAPEVKEAHQLLKQRNIKGFMGNVEAREALDGRADVIVTGGFAGNIFLKSVEGIASMMSGMIKKAFKRNVFSGLGYLLSKSGFKEMKQTMDYKSVGGAMLLGVNGVVVKGHGSSDAYSFSCTLEVAYKMVEANIVEKMKEGLKAYEGH